MVAQNIFIKKTILNFGIVFFFPLKEVLNFCGKLVLFACSWYCSFFFIDKKNEPKKSSLKKTRVSSFSLLRKHSHAQTVFRQASRRSCLFSRNRFNFYFCLNNFLISG